jgi:DNA-binding transcriptional ArsR family regulator
MFRREAKPLGWWQVSADTLAGSRFVVSPLAEATASLIALVKGTAAHPSERAWLDRHRPAYQALLAADPVTAELVRAGVRPRWIAALFSTPPAGPPGSLAGASADHGTRAFAAEVASIREMPVDVALADLAVDLGAPVPPGLRRPDLPERAASLLEWVWTQTVLPYWARRRHVLEADIVARTAKLAQGGWIAALDDMRSGLRWLGEGRLQINAHDYPPREISGAELFFIPVTLPGGWVSWDLHLLPEQSRRYAVIYPASGVLAQPGGAPVPETLRALLGPARAQVLVLLDSPKSTTQLVTLTGLALGSVGRHIQVLYAAGLLGRSRAGRSVLYYRTPAGDGLVAAARYRRTV